MRRREQRQEERREERDSESRAKGRKNKLYWGIGVLIIIAIGYGVVSFPTTGNHVAGGGLVMAEVIDDDPFKGAEDAPVVLVEFSDLQCPACGSFFANTLPTLQKDYIDTGKLKFVYRDMPLISIHPFAQKAAEAAQCAGDQGKFWEYHDVIFQRQHSLSFETLPLWAEEFELDMEQFNQCLDSGTYFNEVQADFADGVSYGVSSTPSFILGPADGTGELITGGQPAFVFAEAIDRLLV